MPSACFAEQVWAVRKAFCFDQCCSALVMRHYNAVSLFCIATPGNEESILF